MDRFSLPDKYLHQIRGVNIRYNAEADCHVLPGNTALLPHNGQVTTRGLQEWVCLLPQDVPFATAQRLLGWLTREVDVISTTQVRRRIQHHGALIRQAIFHKLP